MKLGRLLAISIGFFVVALAAANGWAQNCTLNSTNPYTSATSLSTIAAAINGSGATTDPVACLQRGQTWSTGLPLSLTQTFTGSHRATICAADAGGHSCTRSGAANPIFTTSSDVKCVNFANGTSSANAASGYYVQDLDCYNTATTNASSAFGIGRYSQNITLEGVLEDAFFEPFDIPSHCKADGLPVNIKLGICGGPGHWFEVRNGPATMPDSNRSFGYGGLVNSSAALYVHHFTTSGTVNGHNHSGTSHMWDLGSWDTCDTLTDSTTNMTIECGRYEINSGNAYPNVNGAAFKIWKGTGYVVRDNLFQDVGTTLGASGVSMFGVSDHAITNGGEGISGGGTNCAGAAIYRNTFRGWGGALMNIGRDVCIYDNTFYWQDDSLSRGVYQSARGIQDLVVVPLANVRVYNNTIYNTGSSSSTYGQLWGRDGGFPQSPQTACTDCLAANNLVWLTNSTAPSVVASVCSEFGTNGVNLQNNFVYSPNHAPTVLWDSCSADSGNSSSYSTSPGLTDVATENFHPSGTGVPICSFGTASVRPTSDKDQAVWQNLEVGAYACVGAAPQLAPGLRINGQFGFGAPAP